MARLAETSGGGKHEHGFTLIELMIVISLILILIAIAVPSYNQSIIRARESVLRQNLFTLRSLISQYTLDKQKAPQSLDELVSSGYLKQLPNDPITGHPDWTVEQEESTTMSVDQQEGGIDDVHSSSGQTGSDGTAYSSW
jgi:general secretion pathway protein G